MLAAWQLANSILLKVFCDSTQISRTSQYFNKLQTNRAIHVMTAGNL